MGAARALARMCGLAGLVLVPAVGVTPAGAGSSGPVGGDTIAVNVLGVATNTSTTFGHLVFTVPMYSLVTGASGRPSTTSPAPSGRHPAPSST